jgi:CheY-like chemotaxis protein
VAATAEEALGEVEEERPDAILLDLKTPMLDGSHAIQSDGAAADRIAHGARPCTS